MKIEPYLTFGGNCEEAMTFYKEVLGGEIVMMSRFQDAPEGSFPVPDAFKQQVMHCTLAAKGATIMASDTMEPDQLKHGTNSSISVGIDDAEEAEAVFNGLAQDGQVLMPYEDAFWGGKFGMAIDKFGIQWMVSGGYSEPEN